MEKRGSREKTDRQKGQSACSLIMCKRQSRPFVPPSLPSQNGATPPRPPPSLRPHSPHLPFSTSRAGRFPGMTHRQGDAHPRPCWRPVWPAPSTSTSSFCLQSFSRFIRRAEASSCYTVCCRGRLHIKRALAVPWPCRPSLFVRNLP